MNTGTVMIMDVIDMWWFSLGIFAAVIIVVAVLLCLIIVAARRVDVNAGRIWNTGKRIAGNTVTIWTFEKTHEHLGEIEESLQHLGEIVQSVDENLGAVAGRR